MYRAVIGHPNASKNGNIGEHILVVEKALGHYLPRGAQVHHVNSVRDDNRNENLVACQNRSYHRLIHIRKRALEACGNPDYRSCANCGQYDDLRNMVRQSLRKTSFTHLECRKRRWSAYRERCHAEGRKTWR